MATNILKRRTDTTATTIDIHSSGRGEGNPRRGTSPSFPRTQEDDHGHHTMDCSSASCVHIPIRGRNETDLAHRRLGVNGVAQSDTIAGTLHPVHWRG